MKIPKGYDTMSKSFRLPIELLEELGKIAQNNILSLNKLVTQCLFFELESIKKAEDEPHE
jgi:hypothetical protein